MKFKSKEQAEKMITDAETQRAKEVWGGWIIEYKCPACGFWNECPNSVYICTCGADL